SARSFPVFALGCRAASWPRQVPDHDVRIARGHDRGPIGRRGGGGNVGYVEGHEPRCRQLTVDAPQPEQLDRVLDLEGEEVASRGSAHPTDVAEVHERTCHSYELALADDEGDQLS